MRKVLQSLFTVAFLVIAATPAYSEIFFKANLSGAQAVPAVTTPGSGTFWAVLEQTPRNLHFRVTVAKLQSSISSASISIGAPGVAGTIAVAVSFIGNTAVEPSAGLVITDELMLAMLKGNAYINIVTATHAAGEIRGQIVPASAIEFRIAMTGANEVPPNLTTGRGSGYFLLHNGATADFQFSFSGLTGPATGSHFHIGAAGRAGIIVHGLTVTAVTETTLAGTWSNIPDSILVALVRNRIYLNVHTAANPNGEIRGQLIRSRQNIFAAYMSGSRETPPLTLAAKGFAWLALNAPADTSSPSPEYRMTNTNLTSATNPSAVFVDMASGSGSAPLKTIGYISNSLTADEQWVNMPDNAVKALLKGNLAINVKTSGNPNGEILGRFQIVENVQPMVVTIDTRQVIPAPTTTGPNGAAVFGLNTMTGTITHSERIDNLTGPVIQAHIHKGKIGTVDAGTGLTVSVVDTGDTGVIASVPDSLILPMLRSNAYFDVHTAQNPTGEARGQLYWANYVTSVQQVSNAVPETYRLDQNYPNPFNPSTSFDFSISSGDKVTIKVFNLLGQEMATLLDDFRAPGSYRVTFNASSLPSGVYFYRMQAGHGFIETRKMVLMR